MYNLCSFRSQNGNSGSSSSKTNLDGMETMHMRRIPTFLMMLVAVVGLLPAMALAQSDPAAGFPPFSSMNGGPDHINLGNLNIHYEFPILDKAGRGLPFHYALQFDNSIWSVPYSPFSWQPVNNTFGWKRQTEAFSGYVTYKVLYLPCTINGTYHDTIQYQNWTYFDPSGTAHTFRAAVKQPPLCGGSVASGPADDASGYSITVTNAPSAIVYLPSGGSITVPIRDVTNQAAANVTGPAYVTDANGNFISSGDGVTFTDTLGVPLFTINNAKWGAPYPDSFTYSIPGGGTATTTIGYTTYYVATNFGCAGIKEYPGPAIPLLTSITYPDGSSYQIQYEDTPGLSGYKTGRISQVTLPTGGTISYSYSGGEGAQHGIFCDGTTSAFTRTTNDGTNTVSETFSIARNTDGTTTTHSTSPQGDETVINFSGGVETQRQIYQGASGTGPLMETIETCYNGASQPCISQSPPPFPFAEKTVYVNTGQREAKRDYFYAISNVFARNGWNVPIMVPIEEDAYDWTASGTFGPPLRKNITKYVPDMGTMFDHPSSVMVEDGNSNIVAQTNFYYDQWPLWTPPGTTPQHGAPPQAQRGNLTSAQIWTGSTWLYHNLDYYDTGMVHDDRDVNGQPTIHNFADATSTCGNAFPSSVTPPTGVSGTDLTTANGWDCFAGAAVSATDANRQVVSKTLDSLGRPIKITDPLGNVTNTNYASTTLSETGMWFNGNQSLTDSLTTLDGLGRVHVAQRRQGPGNLLNVFDSVETDYNGNGLPSRTTSEYVATSIGQTNSSAPATTTTYDALGRPLHVQDAAGGTVDYNYYDNDVLITTGPAPNRQKQYEYDALGRLTSVCELTSAANGGVTCGQSRQQTGYWTRYQYDALGDLTGVCQNTTVPLGTDCVQNPSSGQQTRSFQFDALKRLTVENEAETGQTRRIYDSDTSANPLCPSSAGDLVRMEDQAGDVTCYTYDSLHRVVSITYPSGPNAPVTPNKGFIYDSYSGAANAIGRLAVAYTCNAASCSTAWLTSELFSYSARGEVVDFYEATPHSGGAYHVSQSYWEDGAPKQLSGLPGLPSITYGGAIGGVTGRDGEGRVTQVTASSGQNPLTGATYVNGGTTQPLGALTQVNFGSGDSDQFSYDVNSGRQTQYAFSVNGQTDTGALTWNANGDLQKLQITDNIPGTADTQTCNYSHDDLGRIASANCGTAWSQNFSYDPFGNISKSGSVSFQPGTYSASTNQVPKSFGFTYDNNGNVTNDTLHGYAWDADSKARTVDGVNLTYDAAGHMVEQQRGSSYVQVVYGPQGNKFALMNGQTLVKAFVPLPGGATAVYNWSGLTYYRHADHLGSSRLASAAAGTAATGGAGSAVASGSEQSVGSGSSPGTGSVTVNGSEQSVTTPDTPGTGAVTITGSEQLVAVTTTCNDNPDGIDYECTENDWDQGTVSITINGHLDSAGYAYGDTSSSLATKLANAINGDGAAPVTAAVSGSTLYLTSKATGQGANYSVTTSADSSLCGSGVYGQCVGTSPSYAFSATGFNLTGGATGTTTYDTGTVSVTVNGSAASTSYGQGDTAATLASRLVSVLNAGSSPVTASASGGVITLVAKAVGAATNYSLACGSSTSQPGTFSQPSFTLSCSGASLTGGSDGSSFVYDSGSVWVTVNGFQASASYGQASTASGVTNSIISALNTSSSPVTASSNGSGIRLVAKTTGSASNYPLACGSSTSQPGKFSQPSFSVSCSGAALTGGSNAATTMYADLAYGPFGESYAETGNTDRSFTGNNEDTVPGLADFMYREYSSAQQGRWISPDPARLMAVSLTDPQTWNLYAYVANRPLNSTDPLGLDSCHYTEASWYDVGDSYSAAIDDQSLCALRGGWWGEDEDANLVGTFTNTNTNLADAEKDYLSRIPFYDLADDGHLYVKFSIWVLNPDYGDPSKPPKDPQAKVFPTMLKVVRYDMGGRMMTTIPLLGPQPAQIGATGEIPSLEVQRAIWAEINGPMPGNYFAPDPRGPLAMAFAIKNPWDSCEKEMNSDLKEAAVFEIGVPAVLSKFSPHAIAVGVAGAGLHGIYLDQVKYRNRRGYDGCLAAN